jgi:tetratricopeptide (TPR) repeat protein
MRRTLVLATAFLAAVSCTALALAQANKQAGKPRPPTGANPQPVAPPATRPRPNPPAKATSSHRPTGGTNRNNLQGSRSRNSRSPYYFSSRYDYGFPYSYGYPYGYGSPYGYGYPYSYGSSYGYANSGTYFYYYPAPLSYPMVMNLGPLGIQPFQDQGMNNAAANRPAAAPVPPLPDDDDQPAPRRGIDRPTNPRANALAWKYIGYGDGLFAKQRYGEAADRYRRAAGTAPLLAEAWFRRALALTATGRYELAVNAVKRGLKLDPKWPKIVFDAADTLWPDAKDKETYFATLTKLAAEHPASSDVQFLVGLHFHIDGQHDQAKKYFARAQRIAGIDSDHIEAFLDGGG